MQTIHALPGVLLGMALGATAAEFFVAPGGSATDHDGLTRDTAFSTIQRGVDALQPGDTLRILPGEYLESVRRAGLGSNDVDTVIRAEQPGTVVLRGDVPAPAFRRAAGYRYVYVADFDAGATVPAVNEQDTLAILRRMPNAPELEFTPGAFFHDKAAGKLYLSPSDLAPAETHRYTVSVIPAHGFYLAGARRVRIENLDVTGFNALRQLSYHDGTHGGIWGLFLKDARQCVIRDCRAWLNGWGIGLNSSAPDSGDNQIERCAAWGNDSAFKSGDMGGLTGFRVRRDVIRDSIAFQNGMYGINIYGTGTDGGAYGEWEVSGNDEANKSRLVNNLAWGNRSADFKIKTGVRYFHTIEGCIGPGLWSVRPGNVIRSLIGRSTAEFERDTIVLSQEKELDLQAEFVDPVRHDYRLRAGSRFRGTGPAGSDRGPHPYASNAAESRNNLELRNPGNQAPLPDFLGSKFNLPPPRALRLVEPPRVHSLSATTANIEWTTSLPATCNLAWGATPECTNTVTLDANYFGMYSLTGLAPGTTCHFRINRLSVPGPLAERFDAEAVELTGEPLAFTTLAADAAPKAFFVAPDGDDANTGLSRAHAWRTLQHAANRVAVGDTVLIAGGTYRERVRIRATGARNAPIAFRALPGEKVVLDGLQKTLGGAFIATGKSHLRFDGLHFSEFNFFPGHTSCWMLDLAAEFSLYRGRDIRITRCFSDGRNGYTARFVTALDVAGLAIENCVVINKMSGSLLIRDCPNARIEHCVILRPMITSYHLWNKASQPAVVRNNIFTDCLQKKAALNATLLEFGPQIENENNCIFLRFPTDVREVGQGKTVLELGPDLVRDPLLADPLFAGDPGVAGNPADKSGFSPDRLSSPQLDLDFPSFFATHPEAIARGIGLQPEAFAGPGLD